MTCSGQTFLFLFMWTARSNVGWVFRLVNRRRRSPGLLPALNLSGLQPLLLLPSAAHQSLLNGQKSFPSRPRFVPLVYFAVYVRPCTNERGSKPSFCFLPWLCFLVSSFALVAALLFFSFLQYVIVFSSSCIRFLICLTFIVRDICSPHKFPHIAFPLISLGAGTYNSPQMIWVEVSASVIAPPWPNHLLMPPYSVQYISCYSSTRHNVIADGSFQPEVNSPFTRGSKMTFFNTKPWSHHKCSQLLFSTLTAKYESFLETLVQSKVK